MSQIPAGYREGQGIWVLTVAGAWVAGTVTAVSEDTVFVTTHAGRSMYVDQTVVDRMLRRRSTPCSHSTCTIYTTDPSGRCAGHRSYP